MSPDTNPTRLRPRARPARRSRPGVEGLEDRGLMTQAIPTTPGIAATLDGDVFRYRDGSGWADLKVSGITNLVDTVDPSGREELFGRVSGNNDIDSYSFATGKWTFTGGQLDSMTPAPIGIYGLANGHVFAYRDGAGYTSLNASGATELTDNFDGNGREIVYANFGAAGVRYYDTSTLRWTSTGGVLDQMTPYETGIAGTINGYAFTYTDNGGYRAIPGVNGGVLTGVAGVTPSHTLAGGDDLFFLLGDNQVVDYQPGRTRSELDTNGAPAVINTIVPDARGITALSDGVAYHFDPTNGWSYTRGYNFVTLVDSRYSTGGDELFGQTSDGTIWEYSTISNAWYSTRKVFGLFGPSGVYVPSPPPSLAR